MNIALFATGDVGLEVARFLRSQHERLSCLALDSKDPQAEQIRAVAGVAPDRVLMSEALASKNTLLDLAARNIDLALLAWWPYILKPDVIKIPRLGCLNFHPSLLPYNRGKNYNFWSIVEGTPFGVTLHHVDAGVDTGDIAFQARIATSWEDTGKSLYEKAKKDIVRLFIDSFPEIKAGRIPRKPQDPSLASFRRGGEMETASRIDLDRTYTGRELLNLLRARTFPPHPACTFISEGETYEVRVEIRKVEANK
jgi:methionyl-tRNA formyltransferase